MKPKKKEITALLGFTVEKQIPIINHGSPVTAKAIFARLLALGASVLLAAPSFLAAQEFSDWSPPVNLGPTVNTGFIDAEPALSKNGLSLYFNSNRPGGFGGNDIWVSRRASREDAWGAPVNLGPTINTASNEDTPSFSRDGHTMYFNSDRPGGFGMRDIWISRRTNTGDDFGWEAPVNAGPGVNSAFIDAGASYLANDEAGAPLLYFGSNRTAGLYDIYLSAQAANGSWGPAVLVPELSSPLNEQRPSVRFDGLELFLDSDRLGTFGLRDLWVSTRETSLDPWSAPVNLGATVNSTFNEDRKSVV